MTLKPGWWVRYIDGDEYGVRLVKDVTEVGAVVNLGPNYLGRWDLNKCIRVHPPRDVKTRKVKRSELEAWLIDYGAEVITTDHRTFYVQKSTREFPEAKTINAAIIAARKAMRGKT